MTFVSTEPPKYDCEIFNEVNVNSNNKDEDYILDRNSHIDFTDRYLVFVNLKLIFLGFIKRNSSIHISRQFRIGIFKVLYS